MGVWNVSGGCLKCVWRVSRGCLNGMRGVKMYLKGKSGQVGTGQYWSIKTGQVRKCKVKSGQIKPSPD